MSKYDSTFDTIVKALEHGTYPVNHDMATVQANDVMKALGIEDDNALLCGKPRRYFPQQTCYLSHGHSGDHEDDTHSWGNA